MVGCYKKFLVVFFLTYIYYTLIFGPFPNSGFTIATTCSEDTFGSLEFRDTATEMTELRWPCNINNGLPEAWSQKMTPRSFEPDKMYSLSGYSRPTKQSPCGQCRLPRRSTFVGLAFQVPQLDGSV